ncbi:MAG: tetratricopeptide repeat protein [Elainellaceae cyanobacterium]
MTPRHFLTTLIAGLTSVTLLVTPEAVRAQAVVPRVPPIEPEQLEQQGLVLWQQAAQLAQIQQFESAIPLAQLAAQLANDIPEVWLLLGQLYLQVGELQPSVIALEKARSLNPEDSVALFNLGDVYFRLEDYQKSIEYLESGLDASPEVAGAWFDLANAYYKLNRYEQAIDRYEEAVDLEEDFWFAINNIGLVLYEKGDVDEAIDRWEDAVAMTEETEAEPLMAIAVAQFAQGEQDAAVAQAIAALRLDFRYADLEFLEVNLWGPKLLAQTEQLLNLPEVRRSLRQLRFQTNTAAEVAPEAPSETPSETPSGVPVDPAPAPAAPLE